MILRDATPADLERIFEIYDREVLGGTATFETEPRTPAQRLEWFTAHDRSRYPVLVAQVDRSLAGWARLYPWSPRPAYARTAENAVYIDAGLRGRGLGRILLDAIIVRARTAGIKVLIARIAQGNPASVRLHESAGYTTLGVMHGVGEKFGRVLDVELMELQLDDARAGPAEPRTR